MASQILLLERNKKLKLAVRQLEAQVQERDEALRERDKQLLQQSIDLAMMDISTSVSQAMYDFIKMVAESQSKFAKEAKKLL